MHSRPTIHLTRFGSALVCLAILSCGGSSQSADTGFVEEIASPTFEFGQGPAVLIDEAHFNFHTAEGRYRPFAELLREDGYVVRGSDVLFSKDSLPEGAILVVANALSERNQNKWSLPTYPAFTTEEVAAVKSWVEQGGSLFLIADHMPMPGAAENLAAAFDVRFNNGYAVLDGVRRRPPVRFTREDGTLADHPITDGRDGRARIDSVATFTGQAFQAGEDFVPLLTFGPSMVSMMPAVPAQFTPDTPKISVEGWFQGGVLRQGRGRVAVFGEAAMFTAQLAGPQRRPMGMNSPQAPQNATFLLNLMHWLSGRGPVDET